MAMARHLIEREARRVLRHLEGVFLEARGAGYAASRDPGGRARLMLTAEVAAEFIAEGWIARATDGRLALTPQGQAFARRAGAKCDPFRAQHGEVSDLGGGLRRDGAASALDALGRLKDETGAPYLSAIEREAAARLETDFERAQFRPRLTMHLAEPVRSGARTGDADERLTLGAMAARDRVMAALAAAGPGIADMLFETVCLSGGLNEAERALGWPLRSGKALVRLGLQRLAEHYGLTSGVRRPGRIEAWMEAVAGAHVE